MELPLRVIIVAIIIFAMVLILIMIIAGTSSDALITIKNLFNNIFSLFGEKIR